MKRKWILHPAILVNARRSLAVIIIAIFQVTVLNSLSIFNIKPDLLLIVVVIASLYCNLRCALSLSLIAGIFKDLFALNAFAINALLFLCLSYSIIKLSKKITLESDYICAALVFIAVFFKSIIVRLVFSSLGKVVPLGIFLNIAFLESVYTAAVFLLISKIIRMALI